MDRYDYGGALEILKNFGYGESDVAVVVNSCRYAVNFDFKTARTLLSKISKKEQDGETVKGILKNLDKLIDGDPDAMFSELMENIKFQIVNEEYIDFLGRLYRFKEAIFKYLFVKNHIGKSRFSLIAIHMEKREILKQLRKKYRIYNSNLMYGISTYIHRFAKDDFHLIEVEKILNSERLKGIIELRNDSIVGHGFKGISLEDIHKYYGNPYHVLDDFSECLKKLEVNLTRYKYSDINKYIYKLINEL